MSARLQWRRYRRAFRAPLQVSGRTWFEREGIIIRLDKDDGSVGFGEIAPVPWFPVECLEEAGVFLDSLGGVYDGSKIETLPCTSFALGCAMRPPAATSTEPLPCSALLPAGEAAVETARLALDAGYTTLKWKIGVLEPEREWKLAGALLDCITDVIQLRLDANGGLTTDSLRGWGRVLSGAPVEFMEQPLPMGREQEAVDLCAEAGLPLAFDESACTMTALRELSARFPEVTYVIKPSQAGDPGSLCDFLAGSPKLKRVYSSAFESAIGFQAVWHLAASDKQSSGACGFGTDAYFEDDGFGVQSTAPLLESSLMTDERLEALWKRL